MTVTNPEGLAKFYGQDLRSPVVQGARYREPLLLQVRHRLPGIWNQCRREGRKDHHIAALAVDYQAQYVRTALEAVGITISGTGPGAMPTDGDGMKLQLLGVPGGLAGTIIPAGRISQEDPIVQAIGLDHITQWVSNLDASAKFYGAFFGKESSRNANRVIFDVARTKLVLEKAPAGEAPRVHHFSRVSLDSIGKTPQQS